MIHNEYSLPSLGCWPYILNGEVVFEYAGEFRMRNIDEESRMAADETRVRGMLYEKVVKITTTG